MKKRVITIAVIALMLLSVFALASCSGDNESTGNIPVYQGMSISIPDDTANGEEASVSFGRSFTMLSVNSDVKGADQLLNADDAVETHAQHENRNFWDIDKIVKFEKYIDEEIKYYVQPDATFILEVHIDNPNGYEIQSFTLNGTKYANYMFKDGSTMELLLLETNAPQESGYYEYSIDAIKYIDGTTIKDVDMRFADQTVEVGVSYSDIPQARITQKTILTNSIELEIDVPEPLMFMEGSGFGIVVTDGKYEIERKTLEIGKNKVVFSNLESSKTYEFGIFTTIDMVDGNHDSARWIAKEKITTADMYSISAIVAEKESISFEIVQNGSAGILDNVSLYDASTGKLVKKGNSETTQFDNLLSDHKYVIYADYKYWLNGTDIVNWSKSTEISTLAKKKPTVIFSNKASTDTTINADFTLSDKDKIGEIVSVKVFEGENVIFTNPDKKIAFKNLNYYTEYKIEVTYSYNQNDGNGVQIESSTFTQKTGPHIDVTNSKIINTSAVGDGETIYMQVSIDNPDKATPTSVVINGQNYSCTTSTQFDTIYVNIVNNGQLGGGNQTLTVEQVNLILDNNLYAVMPKKNNTSSLYINGRMQIIDFYMVDASKKQVDWVYNGDKVYAMLVVDNPTGYSIDKVTGRIERGTYNFEYDCFDCSNGKEISIENIIKMDNNHFYFEVEPEIDINKVYLTEINYSNQYLSKQLEFDICAIFYNVEHKGIHYIQKPSDLLNMKDGYYYELANDIDLSGIEWTGSLFYGVFNGKSHSIFNMSLVTTMVKNEDFSAGLFSKCVGVIYDLKIKAATVHITSKINGQFKYGLIAGYSWASLIKHCETDANSIISITNGNIDKELMIGGICGYCSIGIIDSCTNNASINIDFESGEMNYLYYAGGVCGYLEMGMIKNTANYAIQAFKQSDRSNMVGRGYGFTIQKCFNTGKPDDFCSFGITEYWETFKVYDSMVLGGSVFYPNGVQLYSNCFAFDILNKQPLTQFGTTVTSSQLNIASFYTDTLGWSADVWDLSDLDVLNGKYPKLK